MAQGILSFGLQTNSDHLPVLVSFDDQHFGPVDIDPESVYLQYVFAEDRQHELVIRLLNKLPHQTVLDAQGHIVKDTLLEVVDFQIDDIPVMKLMQYFARYHHDYNGTGLSIQDNFYGSMGCVGEVRLTIPRHYRHWMLENI